MVIHFDHRGDRSDAMRRAAAKVARKVSRAAEVAMEDATITLQHSAKDLAERATKQSRLATRATRKSVRERPVAWISASVGAGLLLGALLTRRELHH